MIPALEMEDVVFRYFAEGKRNILDHVSLSIPQGRITVLMGASGCGKSTLAAVAAGLYPENGGHLASGTIRLFGEPLSAMTSQQRARYLTMMFQNPDLQFCMHTLRKEMQFCLENLCVPPEDMSERILKTVRQLKAEALLDQPLTTLSGGEKQRAMLCCMVVMASRCLLLDEAFANLDPVSIRRLLPLLKQLRDAGTTIIAIDHQPGYWLDIADEFIVLGKGGRVLQRGITAEDFADHAALFRQEGLACSERSARPPRSPSSETPAIVLRQVSIPRGIPSRRTKLQPEDHLLYRADAVFPKGQITAILGASGCGKTTAFLSMLKQHPYTGQILVEGRDLAAMKEKALYAKVGVVFQSPGNQFITQNVLEEVQAGLRLWQKRADRVTIEAQAETLLEAYDLKAYRRYSPYMLSQGQQRRLAVLSVLAGQQQILFLDEPTYGQDQRSTTAIMQQLQHKVLTEGLTVVFVTHDIALARTWADHVYLLQQRQLIPCDPHALEVPYA